MNSKLTQIPYASQQDRNRRRMQENIVRSRGAIADSVKQAGRSAYESTIGMLRDAHFTTNLPRQAHRDRVKAQERAQWAQQNPQLRQDMQQFIAAPGQQALQQYRQGIDDARVRRQPDPLADNLPEPQQQTTAQPQAGIADGVNMAGEMTDRARANAPPTRVPNRIIQDGNSFYANQPIRSGATIGSTDTLAIGQRDDGRAMRPINTYDSSDVVERGLRASQIRDLARLENSNPNPVWGVRDETRGGFEGERNRRLNERDRLLRQQRTQEHRQDIAQRRQSILDGLAASRASASEAEERGYQRQRDDMAERRAQLGDRLTEQQLALGAMTLSQQEQLDDLRQRISDPELTQEQRSDAERSYQALSTLGRDRYVQQDVVIGHNPETGVPIIGRVAFDTLTGQQLGGEQLQAQAGMRQAQQQARAIVQQGRATREEVNERLIAAGYDPI